MQLVDSRLHRFQQIVSVQAVNQMGNYLGICLTDKYIALGLEFSTQFVMVFNDAVVHQGNAARPLVCI